ADRIFDLVHQAPEARAKDERNLWRAPTQHLGYPGNGAVHFSVSPAKPSGRISAIVMVWTIPVASQRCRRASGPANSARRWRQPPHGVIRSIFSATTAISVM